ncbi:hypothetical protein K469DRAFT_680710 [Zopfia rhizophila CBS 207.26]|uniref:Zn(2)-C6 fungal-type domain-containing protein n=1 Tax=Zopfia rhizophila CBS 207.26 TaxID=1314779 RepID=A0A6A6D8U6_9PEZI|nr:hypothetical protein K469DRAFT_680710 [Zopfia rhizophila CBS 207.26]
MKRFHRKTRAGCNQCKRRRVKCDETKPSCANCVRNHLQCSLEFLTPIKPENQYPKPRAKPITLQIHSTVSPPRTDIGLATFSLDPKNLELLHHYTSVTCLTLGTVRNMHVWQVEIPRLALCHEFLMHGLLAISALHLSTLQTARNSELIRRATMAEHMALPSFRQYVSANEAEKIHAVFAFAGYLVPYLLSLSGWLDAPMGRIPSLDDYRPHWFHVLRGLVSLCGRSWFELAKGPFSPLLVRSVAPVDCNKNPDDAHLVKIYRLLQRSTLSNPANGKTLAVCRTALDELRRVAALPYSPCKTLEVTAVVYIWPGSISQQFLQLMHQRRPEALVILAHYCVLLKKVDSCWYLKGVGNDLLAAIEHELGDEWRPWIAWALAQPVQ